MKKYEAKNENNGVNTVDIFGVKISSTPKGEVLEKIGENLKNRHKMFIVTPNPEILLMAKKDVLLREILNRADVSIPDGFGIKLMYGINIIHGRELFYDILTMINERGGKVYLLGGENKGLTNKAITYLSSTFKGETFKGSAGPMVNEKGIPVTKSDSDIETVVIKEINDFKPDFLFVGFGAPKQEKWIFRNLDRLNIGGAMCVGRTFEYYSGKYPLPPAIVDKMGFEWLWRLLTGSNTIRRVFNAVIIFPLTVLLSKKNKS